MYSTLDNDVEDLEPPLTLSWNLSVIASPIGVFRTALNYTKCFPEHVSNSREMFLILYRSVFIGNDDDDGGTVKSRAGRSWELSRIDAFCPDKMNSYWLRFNDARPSCKSFFARVAALVSANIRQKCPLREAQEHLLQFAKGCARSIFTSSLPRASPFSTDKIAQER